MQDPEGNPMWIRANGTTRRASPYRVELLRGDDQFDQDFIDLEEETPHDCFEDPVSSEGSRD
eukprot:9244461-Prorocentrum_lima.AAC.1